MSDRYDAIVLGGGAAGLMCAARAGQRGKRVLVLERAAKPGKKILISGGGRCNFTNIGAGPGNYLSSNPHFAKSALASYTARDFLALVERYGIDWHEKTLGQLFCDGSAQQIVDLLLDLQRQNGMGIVLITHDLGVVAETADRVAVMYAGAIVETGGIGEVFGRPSHPYTVGLMNSVPRVDQMGGRLTPIVGSPPSLSDIPPGCAFHPRCPRARAVCSTDGPALREVGGGRRSACHFAEEVLGA